MLASVDSREIAEWMAYDLRYGPIGGASDNTLASVHEQLQILTHLLGAVNSEENKNPVPEPQRFPRPGEPSVMEDVEEVEEEIEDPEETRKKQAEDVVAMDMILGFA